MKRGTLALGLAIPLLGLSACKKQGSDNVGIRAGILQHLTSIGTLNMSAMDMDMRSVAVSGNQAHAEVEFRVRNSGSPGGGMQVAYDLEKLGDAWVVLKSQPLSGMQHPSTGQSSGASEPVHAMPNFSELLNPSGSAPGQTVPPDHPSASSLQQASPSVSKDQRSAKKPQ